MFAGINRKVRYAMKESDGHFTIDPVSGIVSLARPLDREIQSVYNLTLYAHDQVRKLRKISLFFKEVTLLLEIINAMKYSQQPFLTQ